MKKPNLVRKSIGSTTFLCFGILSAFVWAGEMSPSALFTYFGQGGRKTTDPPTMAKGNLGQDLFLAIDHRDTAAVKSLLSKGADPNSRNGLEFVPIYVAVASYQPEVVDALLSAGADPNADSPYGTALLFASGSGNLAGVKTLLGKKVNVGAIRNDGMNALMMAAFSGSVPVVQELLTQGAKVDDKDLESCTALFYAVRNEHLDAAKALIKAGANVNLADVSGVTPLMLAAQNGNTEMVQALLASKANVNAKDKFGQSPLLYGTTYSNNPKVVSALLHAGADKKAMNASGKSPAAIAVQRGKANLWKLLSSGKMPTVTKRSPSAAVKSGLSAIQVSMKKFSEMTDCVSCHQEGLGRMVTAKAKDHGFSIDQSVESTMRKRVNFVMEVTTGLHEQAVQNAEVMKQVPLIEINEVSTGYSWLLAGRSAQKEPISPGAVAMTMVVAKQQSPDGFWSFSIPRVPMQSSFFTFTALSIQALSTYGMGANATESKSRIERARKWLTTAPAKTSEDRASQLLGLRWAGQKPAELKKFSAAILADQRADGGWSQLPNLASDAYATGQAIYALRTAGGLPTSHPAVQKGIQFLLRTQDGDGSWFVNKRAFPANNYFDGGFAHGQSQYSSFNGTCWATMALMETLK